ncbi:MAG: CBS domain-containing protein [Gammaproteobacteria bacterium]|nr:CBS domain-containing protein [Gammaproteobacteria bacterium]
MINVQTLLDEKGHAVWAVLPEDNVFDAVKLMDSKSVGALAVLQGKSLAGIISERDYARKVILKGRSSKETKVKEIMTRNVYYATLDQSVETCMVVMSKYHIRHLPVLHDDELIGMISLGDVVKEIIKEQKIKIVQLENTLTWQESY